MLLPATTGKPGEPYDDLAELYGRMLGQWALEMNHVAAIVVMRTCWPDYVIRPEPDRPR
jgi:hypothetical protein